MALIFAAAAPLDADTTAEQEKKIADVERQCREKLAAYSKEGENPEAAKAKAGIKREEDRLAKLKSATVGKTKPKGRDIRGSSEGMIEYKDGTFWFDTRERQARHIETSVDHLTTERARLARILVAPELRGKLEVGSFGTFVYPIKITQVIDEKNLIGKAMWFGEPTRPDGPSPQHWQSVWVSGVNTEKLVDDGTVKLEGIWFVCGTKKYETQLGGTRTVLELRPLKLDDAKGEKK